MDHILHGLIHTLCTFLCIESDISTLKGRQAEPVSIFQLTLISYLSHGPSFNFFIVVVPFHTVPFSIVYSGFVKDHCHRR